MQQWVCCKTDCLSQVVHGSLRTWHTLKTQLAQFRSKRERARMCTGRSGSPLETLARAVIFGTFSKDFHSSEPMFVLIL